MQDRKLASPPESPPHRGQLSLVEPIAEVERDPHVDAIQLRAVLQSWRARLRELDHMPADSPHRVDLELAIAALQARYQRLFDSVSVTQHAEAEREYND